MCPSFAPSSQMISAPFWSLKDIADSFVADDIQFKIAFMLIPLNSLLLICMSYLSSNLAVLICR
ncbi:Uncharacterised protein [Klebsiella pneumoniae]|nr:Uncharacterised protein [Klebsiella pneumoniae]